MARPICVNCRHFQSQKMYPAAWCMNPNATTIDRVRGDQHPRLDPAISPIDAERIKDLTDRCDSESWFQARKPWWI